MNKTISFASVVSEIAQSDLYMTVKARLFETPKANLNGARVTPAFMDEILEHEEKYVGLPLSADVKAMAKGNYDHLGHLYDPGTGEFKSAMIGSFYHFEKEEFDGGAYLVGYARIMKRYKAVCRAVAELFADGALKFSFEVAVGEYKKLNDGTIEIDASDSNFLEGVAIVSLPACEDAVALELVAECNRIEDETKRGEKEMTEAEKEMETTEAVEETIVSEETPEVVTETAKEEVEETIAEEVSEETSEEVVSETPAEETAEEKPAEEESAACKKEEDAEEKETADLHVTESVTVKTQTDTYNDATNECTHEENEHEESVSYSLLEPEYAETKEEEEENTIPITVSLEEETTEPEEEVQQPENQTGEQNIPELIAELMKTIDSLRQEIAELKEEKKEESHVTAEINPFTDTINPVGKKYSLLESDQKRTGYTLLD